MTITPAEALAERARREKARRHLIDFAMYVAPWYKPARAHRLVAEKLEQVKRYIETGGTEGCGRLIINMPFRHGKSELVTRLFSSFVLGTLPDKRVMVTSYGADLAEDDSRKVRDYVSSDGFRALFGDLGTYDDEGPVEVSQETRKRANWSLQNHRGGVTAAGIGGGIVGKGAHLLIIDDPYKKRDEADSENYRKSVMRWYRGSAYTRLEDGGAIIVIHTRWHPNDLTGELLAEMASGMGEPWEVVHLPMLALEANEYPETAAQYDENLLRGIYIPIGGDPLSRQPGQALWPEKYNETAAERIRQNIGDDEFISQGQQLPAQVSGGFFDELDFPIVEHAPEGLQWYVYIDLALGKTAISDYNAAVAEAMDHQGVVYLRDMLRERKLETFLDDLMAWMLDPDESGTIWGVEDANFQTVVWMDLIKDKRLADRTILAVQPNGDKVTRARPLRNRGRRGKVKLVRGTWNLKFIREAIGFPTGKNDDQVDTASGGLQMIAEDARETEKPASSPAMVFSSEQLFGDFSASYSQ
jgi:predicted phage terminase large subunit-like protein